MFPSTTKVVDGPGIPTFGPSDDRYPIHLTIFGHFTVCSCLSTGILSVSPVSALRLKPAFAPAWSQVIVSRLTEKLGDGGGWLTEVSKDDNQITKSES